MLIRLFLLALLSLLISGCFPWLHRIEVQQGNIVEPEQLSRLQPGMSREQVRFILGTPILEQGLDPNRWDYYYSLRDSNGDTRSYWLRVNFDQLNYRSHSIGKEIFDLRNDIHNPVDQ